MSSKASQKKKIGVIGAGSFGTAVANILAQKEEVILYARNVDLVEKINNTRWHKDAAIHPNITGTSDLSYIASQCEILFPVIPSSAFREVMKQLAPYLRPYHILIHGTKGLDISTADGNSTDSSKILTRDNVRTMSEVIRDESVVIRVGCLAGPNLARELTDHQPAATVIASHFNEVIELGQKYLRNDRFQVYGNSDLIGIELAGVLKNIIAIAAGALSGLGLGENAKGLLISRGMIETIYLGRALGGKTESFLGLAGVGDLVTTCNSSLSRNFTVGFRLAKGEPLEDIISSMDEVAEGVNTVKIVHKLARQYKVKALITQTLHRVLFEGMSVKDGLQYLMKYPLNVDIAFLKNLQ
ncbi:MAG: NAD(P)-dependent glycerol-3-phosphate dehydrogenase [Cyclobacteriaceae bacterium]|nr:NAD(P)-dependent glycerol-3-phosphate dehydrogenase [Cyclobacteriaceae bacterium]